ncbi:MAG TPA: hypothetical protein VGC08_16365 [Pedobacter sp.]
MKRANPKLIIIPLEFKIACTICKLNIQEVLQTFINHVTIYDTICPWYNEGFSEASRTISAYIKSRKRKFRESKALLHCDDQAVNCLNGILGLARKETGNPHVKRKKSLPHVNSMFKMMKRTYALSDILYLDENTSLHLTKDFCVLCELHNCYPKVFLEYFMSMISMADYHAKKGLKITEENLTVDLFMKIANGFARDTSQTLRLTDMELEFYERMEELRLQLYNIKDLAERTAILKDFYLSHYHQMNP